jgi:D-beta-D-heptose 7-phosphate kinase/D-beta-D-heptose 1-phosphate adenosyltransferase
VTSQRCRSILENAATKRFVVVGDLMLDEFVRGKVSRISPEAPVPIVHVTEDSLWFPGGAANVARNLHEFAGSVAVAGAVGCDVAGERLLSLLAETGIDVAHVSADAASATIVKTRIIARQQQVVRVDRERPGTAHALIGGIEVLVAGADAVIVADYGKGAITQELADQLSDLAHKHRRILAVDPNPGNPVRWGHVTVIKPNRAEAFRAAGVEDDDSRIEAVGRRLLDQSNAEILLLTLGEEGMMLFEHGKPTYRTPTRAREVFDVSGAGDTAIAVLTAALTGGAAPTEAAEIANAASGIVVGKLGTAAVTLEELVTSFSD